MLSPSPVGCSALACRNLYVGECLTVDRLAQGRLNIHQAIVPALGCRLLCRSLQLCCSECLNRDSWDSFHGSVLSAGRHGRSFSRNEIASRDRSVCIGLSASLPPPSGVLFGVLESRLLGLVSWVGLERRSARRGTRLFVPSAPFKPST